MCHTSRGGLPLAGSARFKLSLDEFQGGAIHAAIVVVLLLCQSSHEVACEKLPPHLTQISDAWAMAKWASQQNLLLPYSLISARADRRHSSGKALPCGTCEAFCPQLSTLHCTCPAKAVEGCCLCCLAYTDSWPTQMNCKCVLLTAQSPRGQEKRPVQVMPCRSPSPHAGHVCKPDEVRLPGTMPSKQLLACRLASKACLG